MSTLSDMTEIDQIAHWCYILTWPWHLDIPRSWQGHQDVTARSNQLKTAENIYFLQDIFSCFEQIWPCRDPDMTLKLPWGNNPVKYNPISTCSLRVALMFIGHWSKYNISVLFWPFHPYQTVLTQGWRKGEGGGVKNPPTLMLFM